MIMIVDDIYRHSFVFQLYEMFESYATHQLSILYPAASAGLRKLRFFKTYF